MPRKKALLSNNPFEFTTIINPILETERITREEMVRLPCRMTHMIKPRSLRIPEDDNLYAIYADQVGKSIPFIRSWLRCFMISNDTIIKKRAKEYFKSKGISLKVWVMAIREGRKGDILSLYALSLMLDVHVVVHLHNGATWTTLKSPINDHDELLKRCPVHLAYLGMGIFVEMVKREMPLQLLALELSGNPESDSIIIGEFVVKQEPMDPTELDDYQRVSSQKKQALTMECSVRLNRLEIDSAC